MSCSSCKAKIQSYITCVCPNNHAQCLTCNIRNARQCGLCIGKTALNILDPIFNIDLNKPQPKNFPPFACANAAMKFKEQLDVITKSFTKEFIWDEVVRQPSLLSPGNPRKCKPSRKVSSDNVSMFEQGSTMDDIDEMMKWWNQEVLPLPNIQTTFIPPDADPAKFGRSDSESEDDAQEPGARPLRHSNRRSASEHKIEHEAKKAQKLEEIDKMLSKLLRKSQRREERAQKAVQKEEATTSKSDPAISMKRYLESFPEKSWKKPTELLKKTSENSVEKRKRDGQKEETEMEQQMAKEEEKEVETPNGESKLQMSSEDVQNLLFEELGCTAATPKVAATTQGDPPVHIVVQSSDVSFDFIEKLKNCTNASRIVFPKSSESLVKKKSAVRQDSLPDTRKSISKNDNAKAMDKVLKEKEDADQSPPKDSAAKAVSETKLSSVFEVNEKKPPLIHGDFTNMDRKISCPETDCSMSFMHDEILKHFAIFHCSNMLRASVDLREYYSAFIEPFKVQHGFVKCCALFLVMDNGEPIGKDNPRDFLPMLLMVSRIDHNFDPRYSNIRVIDDQDVFKIWVCGVLLEDTPLSVSWALGADTGLLKKMPSAKIINIQSTQDAYSVPEGSYTTLTGREIQRYLKNSRKLEFSIVFEYSDC